MNDPHAANDELGPPKELLSGFPMALSEASGISVDAAHRFDRLRGIVRCEPPEIPPQHLAELAARIYAARQLRASFLNLSLLGEPVWDMLLTLYCQRARGERLSVSGLCYSAGVPPTTALRWSKLLEQKNLIVRTPDANDARRTHLSLTDHGQELMSTYLATVYGKLCGPYIG